MDESAPDLATLIVQLRVLTAGPQTLRLCWCATQGALCDEGPEFRYTVAQRALDGPIPGSFTQRSSGCQCFFDTSRYDCAPTPATHAILTVLKAGERVYLTHRVFKTLLDTTHIGYRRPF